MKSTLKLTYKTLHASHSEKQMTTTFTYTFPPTTQISKSSKFHHLSNVVSSTRRPKKVFTMEPKTIMKKNLKNRTQSLYKYQATVRSKENPQRNNIYQNNKKSLETEATHITRHLKTDICKYHYPWNIYRIWKTQNKIHRK